MSPLNYYHLPSQVTTAWCEGGGHPVPIAIKPLKSRHSHSLGINMGQTLFHYHEAQRINQPQMCFKIFTSILLANHQEPNNFAQRAGWLSVSAFPTWKLVAPYIELNSSAYPKLQRELFFAENIFISKSLGKWSVGCGKARDTDIHTAQLI